MFFWVGGVGLFRCVFVVWGNRGVFWVGGGELFFQVSLFFEVLAERGGDKQGPPCFVRGPKPTFGLARCA